MNNMMSRSIFALTICSAGWLSPAIAQSNETASDDQSFSHAVPISKDIMRSSSKWIGSINLTDPADPIARPASAASPSMQFKLAEPAWIGVLNTVGQIAATLRVEPSNFGISGKINQPTSRVNSPLPPSN